MQTTTTECTVWCHGGLLLEGSRRECERLWQAVYAVLSPGEVVSLRDADDMTIRKASMADDGEVTDWV